MSQICIPWDMMLYSWRNNSDSSGNHLHPGKIHSVNFDQIENQNYWQLQLDYVDESELYPMKYDAVLAYADESSLSYSSFRVLAQLVHNPLNLCPYKAWELDSDGEDGRITRSSESKNCKEYIKTKPENWTVLKDGKDGRIVEPIPHISEYEENSVKLTNEELAGVKDDNGGICFSKVMEFCLSSFWSWRCWNCFFWFC